jgi:hypothetical protein
LLNHGNERAKQLTLLPTKQGKHVNKGVHETHASARFLNFDQLNRFFELNLNGGDDLQGLSAPTVSGSLKRAFSLQ